VRRQKDIRMSRTTQLLKRIRSYFIWLIQTIAFLSAIVTLLLFLGIGTAFAGYISQVRNLILVGIGIVIFSLLFGIIYYTILQELTKLRDHPVENNPNKTTEEGGKTPLKSNAQPTDSQLLSKDVEILRKEIVYEYLPDGQSIFQRKHIKLRALKNNVKIFEDRYRWTGNGKCILRSKTSGFEITNQLKDEEGIWDYFDVAFPRALHTGDTAEFTIEWELFDEQAQAKTFLSAMIDRETEYLLLQVNLPSELAPTSAYFCEYENFIDKEPLFVERLNWSPATRSLKYEIHNPVKYHQYFIRWYRE
jgi:hypothetical protein